MQKHDQVLIKKLTLENAKLREENAKMKQELAKKRGMTGLICPGCWKPADEGDHSIQCFRAG